MSGHREPSSWTLQEGCPIKPLRSACGLGPASVGGPGPRSLRWHLPRSPHPPTAPPHPQLAQDSWGRRLFSINDEVAIIPQGTGVFPTRAVPTPPPRRILLGGRKKPPEALRLHSFRTLEAPLSWFLKQVLEGSRGKPFIWALTGCQALRQERHACHFVSFISFFKKQ